MRIAAAGLALAEGRPRDAVDVLAPVIADAGASAGGSPQVLRPRWAAVHARLCDAVARDRLGDPRGAQASVEGALELAEPLGLVLPFAVTPVRELRARHRGHRTAHAALLATILGVLAGDTPAPPLGEPLSDAELRVVRYLPSNLKAPEIAAELFVSPNTVRTHVRHIDAKLGAHTREAAVRHARRCGLLAPSARGR